MESLTLIFALVFILAAMSFTLLSSKTGKYSKRKNSFKNFFISSNVIRKQFSGNSEDGRSELSLTLLESKMRNYVNAKKYKNASTLHQLKKLEKEWV